MSETAATEIIQPGTGTNSDPLAAALLLDAVESAGSGEADRAKSSGPPAGDSTPKMELTLQQQQLLSALVVDPNIQAACKTAGVGRSTAHRWLKELQDIEGRLAALEKALKAQNKGKKQ